MSDKSIYKNKYIYIKNGMPVESSALFDRQKSVNSDIVLKLNEELVVEKSIEGSNALITPRRKFSFEPVSADEAGQIEYNIDVSTANENAIIAVYKRSRLFVGTGAQIVTETNAKQVLYIDVAQDGNSGNIEYNADGDLIFLGGHAVQKNNNRYSLKQYPAVQIEPIQSDGNRLKILLPAKNKKSPIHYILKDGYLHFEFIVQDGTLHKDAPVLLSAYDTIKIEPRSPKVHKTDSQIDLFVRSSSRRGFQAVFYSIHANSNARFVEVSNEALRGSDDSHRPYHQNVYTLSSTRNYWMDLRQLHANEYDCYTEIKNWHEKLKYPCRGFKPLKNMAEAGMFDGVLRPDVIAFLKKGFLPIGCSVHHNIPLSMHGENADYNYVLIPYPLHTILHNLLGDSGLFDMLKPIQNIINDNAGTIVFRMPVLDRIIFCKEDLYRYFNKEAVDAEYNKLSDEDCALLSYYENLLLSSPQRVPENEKVTVNTIDLSTVWQQQLSYLNINNVYNDEIERNWGSSGYSEEKAAERRMYTNAIRKFDDNAAQMLQCLYYLGCLTDRKFFVKSRQVLTDSVEEMKKIPEQVQFLCTLSGLLGKDISVLVNQSLVKGLNRYNSNITDETFETYLGNGSLQITDTNVYDQMVIRLKELNKNRKGRRFLTTHISRGVTKQAQVLYVYYYLTGEDILAQLKPYNLSGKNYNDIILKLNKISQMKRLLKNKQLLKTITKGNFELVRVALAEIFPNVNNTYVKSADSDLKKWLTSIFTNQATDELTKWEEAHHIMSAIVAFSSKLGITRIMDMFRYEMKQFHELVEKVKQLGLMSSRKRAGKVYMRENAEALHKIIAQSVVAIKRFKQNEAFYLLHTVYENTLLFPGLERTVYVSDYTETVVVNLNQNTSSANVSVNAQNDEAVSSQWHLYSAELQAANSAAYNTGYFSSPISEAGKVLYSYLAPIKNMQIDTTYEPEPENEGVTLDIERNKTIIPLKTIPSVKDALMKQAAERGKSAGKKTTLTGDKKIVFLSSYHKTKKKISHQIQKQRN